MDTDRKIISRIRENPAQGFDALYDAYAPAVYGFLLKQGNKPEQADRLLATILEEGVQKILESNPGEVRLLLWLLAIARSQTQQREKKELALEQLEVGIKAGGFISMLEALEQPFAGKLLFEAIYTGGCSVDEVCTRLGCTKTQVGMAVRKNLLFTYQTS